MRPKIELGICMRSCASAPVHEKSASAPWITKFVKETVDDALNLLGHGQARYVLMLHSPTLIAFPESAWPGAFGPAGQSPRATPGAATLGYPVSCWHQGLLAD